MDTFKTDLEKSQKSDNISCCGVFFFKFLVFFFKFICIQSHCFLLFFLVYGITAAGKKEVMSSDNEFQFGGYMPTAIATTRPLAKRSVRSLVLALSLLLVTKRREGGSTSVPRGRNFEGFISPAARSFFIRPIS